MREARSYSMVDHELLHGGYLARLTHRAMALYLLLVVVGDREGRSFYSDSSLIALLRLETPELHRAREELVREGLVRYRRPYSWVQSLTKAKAPPVPRACLEQPNRREAKLQPLPIRGLVPEGLKSLLRSLEGQP
jgi:hypothetical protein